MPRPRGEPCVDWKLRLQMELAASIEQLTMDPSTGMPRYGARRQLIEHLLRRYLREIGWLDSSVPIIDRAPLTDADIEAIATNNVQPLFL